MDDVLDTKIERKFQLVIDKGTLDAIGLHPDGPIKRCGTKLSCFLALANTHNNWIVELFARAVYVLISFFRIFAIKLVPLTSFVFEHIENSG